MTAADLTRHPLYPVFQLVAAEYDRSLKEHKPWHDHTERAMHAIAAAEVGEMLIAIETREAAEVLTEFIHVGNAACKAVAELTRRRP